jgi:hypothetical protein
MVITYINGSYYMSGFNAKDPRTWWQAGRDDSKDAMSYSTQAARRGAEEARQRFQEEEKHSLVAQQAAAAALTRASVNPYSSAHTSPHVTGGWSSVGAVVDYPPKLVVINDTVCLAVGASLFNQDGDTIHFHPDTLTVPTHIVDLSDVMKKVQSELDE